MILGFQGLSPAPLHKINAHESGFSLKIVRPEIGCKKSRDSGLLKILNIVFLGANSSEISGTEVRQLDKGD